MIIQPTSRPTRRPRSSLLRRLGCVTTIVAALVTGAGLTTSAHATTALGYVFVHPQLRGEAPNGFSVYVSSVSPHHVDIAMGTSATIRTLASYGLKVRYSGYGHPNKTVGIITVSESLAGCSGGSTVLANTIWWYAGLPGGGVYMYRSDIIICPTRYGHLPAWQRSAVIRHEFGHAMGLGHMNGAYSGSYQLMNSVTHSGISTYRPGDAAGLRRLAAATAYVRRVLG